MNQIRINVMFTQTFDKEPMAVLSPFYSNRSALTPKELRAIAATLTKIADDAFDHPTTKRTFRAVTRSYDVKV
jgi:hypothetical protein